ncbi:unnamed protein product, partial [Didymodactylos carnosus]
PQADLQLLMYRIRIGINILNDFKNKRELNCFLPVMALTPQPNERILDTCTAPDLKLDALMRNSGTLVVNDANKIV